MTELFQRIKTDRTARLFGAGAGVALLVGLVRSIQLRWVCDDIFITYRYIDNWFGGLGIVYNAGERVEGYTHFLWLIVLAAAHAVGVDLLNASMWIGILSYVATIAVLILISWRLTGGATWTVPFAALAFALNYDANVWATSGMETSFATLLLVLAFYCWFFADLPAARRLLFTGTALVLATMTRPDASLFLAGANGLLVADMIRRRGDRKEAARDLGLFNAAVIVLLVPYLIWKVSYYGDLLPATYYAKSGGASYFEQGFFYIWLYFKAYFSSALFLLAAPVIFARMRRVTAAPPVVDPSDASAPSEPPEPSEPSDPAAASEKPAPQPAVAESPILPAAVALGGVLVYLVLYVARVGGDFMFARFIIPVVPFVYYLVEDTVRRVSARSGRKPVIIMAVLLASVLYENIWRDDVLFYRRGTDLVMKTDATRPGGDATGETRGIVDERWFYYTQPAITYQSGQKLNRMEAFTLVGQWFNKAFAGLNVGVCLQGGHNVIGYYAKFNPSIVNFGLTDKYIASLPITQRGRIGHEKNAPIEYLSRRNVSFKLVELAAQQPASHPYYEAWFMIPELNIWMKAVITSYDRALFAELRRRFKEQNNPSFIADYDAFVPQYISTLMPRCNSGIVRADYLSLKLTYFNRYPDSTSENAFLNDIRTKQAQGK